ncbi:dienelactone hydrolase family protein [Nocardia sp. 2]|uniref:Dienelactone hydrolase family protein n=1 Tax=Nocardia acididurans TaxID=2802282 RepID=A0ABS1M164_9NOCA|nr:dienelactone hydrolase family protein [Nocardia acididurans]MBL1074261.1 dienelactone hydrolase family protein [Nocardia acididurans]
MNSEMVRISTPGGDADAFVAYPDGGGHFPGVLLYSDAFGPRPVLKTMARELARHGYYVLVPNIYYRHGEAPVVEIPEHVGEDIRGTLIGTLMPFVREHSVERILRDAGAYLEFLAQQPEVRTGTVGVVGYCIGSVLALRTAAAYPERVDAVAGFHPFTLVSDAPDSPHLQVPTLTARVHLGLAETDMTVEQIAVLERAFDAAGVDHTVEVYPGTIHGFTMSDTDAFDSAGLQRHWDRLTGLLEQAQIGVEAGRTG